MSTAMCEPGTMWFEYHCITARPGSCEWTGRKYTQQRTYVCEDGHPVEVPSEREFVRCGC